MIRNSRRQVAVAALVLVPVISGCAAGRDAQTTQAYQATEAVSASHNGVEIRNLFVLGPAPGQALAMGADAAVYLSLINNTNTPDRLVAIAAPEAAASGRLPGGCVYMPPKQLISPGQMPGRAPAPAPVPAPSQTTGSPAPGETEGSPAPGEGAGQSPGPEPSPSITQGPGPEMGSPVTLRGLTAPLRGGEWRRLTFQFQEAGMVTVNVPVVPAQGTYSTYAPAPAPVPPTPVPSARGPKRPGTSDETPGPRPTPTGGETGGAGEGEAGGSGH